MDDGATFPVTSNRDHSLIRWATYASVAIAVVLICAKFVAWRMTGSVSLLSTLLDSILDAFASLVNLVAVRHALTPADREHRFGHGKAEALAGLTQSAFIAGSAAFLVIEGVSRLIDPTPLMRGTVGLSVMAFSIVLTVALVSFQMYVVRRTKSVAISADSMHYRADILVNLGVMAALAISTFWSLPLADPIIALLISAYILHGAWEIAISSLDMLMDRELPDEDREKIKALVLENEDVQGIHDLRTRSSGRDIFIQMHLDLDPHMPLLYAHGVSEEVEARLIKAYPMAEVIIHEDPAGFDDTHPEVKTSPGTEPGAA